MGPGPAAKAQLTTSSPQAWPDVWGSLPSAWQASRGCASSQSRARAPGRTARPTCATTTEQERPSARLLQPVWDSRRQRQDRRPEGRVWKAYRVSEQGLDVSAEGEQVMKDQHSPSSDMLLALQPAHCPLSSSSLPTGDSCASNVCFISAPRTSLLASPGVLQCHAVTAVSSCAANLTCAASLWPLFGTRCSAASEQAAKPQNAGSIACGSQALGRAIETEDAVMLFALQRAGC